MAGAPCPVEVMSQVRSKMHMTITGKVQKFVMRQMAAAELPGV
jgi:hypothetical protein